MDKSHKGKEKPRNIRANYKKGARRKITGLLLYVGILPTKSLKLINLREQTVKDKAYDMDNEGVLKKERLWRGEWAYRIARMPEDKKELSDLQKAFPKTYEQYMENGAMMLRRSKGMTSEGDPLRMVRNAETVMFLDALPVKYMPEEKETVNDSFNGNVYFNAIEFREFNKSVTPVKTGYTRANGVMFTNGGTYVIYNYSNNLIELQEGNESYMKEHVMFASIMHGMDSAIYALALYRSDELLQQLIRQETYYASTQKMIDKHYKGVYALPLTREGQELAAYMCVAGWREALMDVCRVKKDWKNTGSTDDEYYSDGIIENNDNGERIKRYVFLFAIPDIKRFKRFLDYVEGSDHPERFAIRCFDFQINAVAPLAKKGVDVRYFKFETIMKCMKERHNR